MRLVRGLSVMSGHSRDPRGKRAHQTYNIELKCVVAYIRMLVSALPAKSAFVKLVIPLRN